MILKSKKILITGGSRGIGFELIKLFLKENAIVYNLSRTKPSITHPNLFHLQVNLDNINFVKNPNFKIIKSTDFDIVVNNVGLNPGVMKFECISDELIFKGIKVNILSHVLITKHVNCKKHVFVNSMLGLVSCPENAIYCASKAFINSFANTLRMEGRDVFIIYPGKVDTTMFVEIKNFMCRKKENVAEGIFKGILKDLKTKYMPFSISLLPFLMSFTPLYISDFITNFIYKKIKN